MAGRIVTYIHNDKTTANKGGSLVRVCCETDFTAKTDLFITFANEVAMLSYATCENNDVPWETVIQIFPDLEEKRITLSAKLKENVRVDQIHIMHL